MFTISISLKQKKKNKVSQVYFNWIFNIGTLYCSFNHNVDYLKKITMELKQYKVIFANDKIWAKKISDGLSRTFDPVPVTFLLAWLFPANARNIRTMLERIYSCVYSVYALKCTRLSGRAQHGNLLGTANAPLCLCVPEEEKVTEVVRHDALFE